MGQLISPCCGGYANAGVQSALTGGRSKAKQTQASNKMNINIETPQPSTSCTCLTKREWCDMSVWGYRIGEKEKTREALCSISFHHICRLSAAQDGRLFVVTGEVKS